DHRDLDLTGLAQMQLGPAPHFDTPAFGIGALPRAIRLPMATLVAALEARPIQRTATTLAWLTRRSGTIKDAVAFDAQQTTGTELCHPSQKRGTGVPAIPDEDGAQPLFHQQEDDLAQLAGCYPVGHLLSPVALGCQHKGSLTCLFGQGHR